MNEKFDRSKDFKHAEWSEKVRKRDGFRCRICKNKGVELNAHHMNSYAYFHTERYDVRNGVTLCTQCHDLFHSIYGKNLSTKTQFKEFKQFTQLIEKIEREKLGLSTD